MAVFECARVYVRFCFLFGQLRFLEKVILAFLPQTAFTGVCHSDLHQWEDVLDFGDEKIPVSAYPSFYLPNVPGHEVSGYVHSLGANHKRGKI